MTRIESPKVIIEVTNMSQISFVVKYFTKEVFFLHEMQKRSSMKVDQLKETDQELINL